jgi:hypothetical protein
MTDQQLDASAPVEGKRAIGTVASSAEMHREWKSCCFLVNPQAATFAVQVLFSLFLILFSAFKVSGSGPPEPLWVSILTSTIATWLPSPMHGSPITLPNQRPSS